VRAIRATPVAALVAAALAVQPAHADNLLAGTWTIVRAEPAPWSDAKTYRPAREEVPRYVGKRVVFAAERIDGPELLACTRPSYAMVDSPAEGLFQGMLGSAESSGGRKAEEAATALGYATRPVRTLRTDCTHSIDYHMSDANNAAFALDNMIYWLRRDGTP
jgi:hypothetical protein